MTATPVEVRREPATTTTPVEAVQNLNAATTQTELLSALRFALIAAPTRPSVPILGGVLIEGDSKNLAVSCFDYELSTTERLPSKKATGRALVPARHLLEIVAAMTKGCDIILKSHSDRLEVTGDGVTYLVPHMPIDEYPSLPSTGADLLATFDYELIGQFSNTVVACGKDDALPVLTGVRMEFDDGQVVLAATDRYRLTVHEAKGSEAGASQVVLVKGDVLTVASKYFGKALAVEVRHSPGFISFTAGGRTLTTRTLEGEFPKFRALLPTEFDRTFTVDRKALERAVKQVAVVAARTTPIRLELAKDGVLISAGGGDATEAHKPVDGIFEGDSMTIALNPKFLLDGLTACGGEQIEFGFTGPAKPAVLRDAERTDFRYLLMPVRLSG